MRRQSTDLRAKMAKVGAVSSWVSFQKSFDLYFQRQPPEVFPKKGIYKKEDLQLY